MLLVLFNLIATLWCLLGAYVSYQSGRRSLFILNSVLAGINGLLFLAGLAVL